MVALVAGRAVIAHVVVLARRDARRAEVVAGHLERAAAALAVVDASRPRVAVEARRALAALRPDRVVQARTARRQVVRVARRRVTVTLTRHALELASSGHVAAHVAEGALLAGQSRVAGRAGAQFDPSGALRGDGIFRTDVQFRFV